LDAGDLFVYYFTYLFWAIVLIWLAALLVIMRDAVRRIARRFHRVRSMGEALEGK
jgi:hypothetical protein